MKTPRSQFDLRWEQLVRRAQADVGPPADVPALLRVVNQISLIRPESWRGEFVGLFGTGPALPACLAGTATIAMVTTWQILTLWQALPWAQLLATTTGGGQ